MAAPIPLLYLILSYLILPPPTPLKENRRQLHRQEGTRLLPRTQHHGERLVFGGQRMVGWGSGSGVRWNASYQTGTGSQVQHGDVAGRQVVQRVGHERAVGVPFATAVVLVRALVCASVFGAYKYNDYIYIYIYIYATIYLIIYCSMLIIKLQI